MTIHFGGVQLVCGRLTPVLFNCSVILAEIVSPQEAVAAEFLDTVVSEVKFAAAAQTLL